MQAELVRPYRGRFAPSPTGGLHLGLARTALLGYLRARAQGGRYVLRVEDLDGPRVVAGAAAEIMEDLRFLGIEWDEGPDRGGPFGPYTQSERFARYEAAIARLARDGRIYPCTCSRKEIALASAPHGPAEFGPSYPGTCRNGPSREGPAALRFRVPDPLPSFVDLASGEHVPPLAQGDFVVRRADGQYSYQLAVV
ncbi:MAG TPA: glutamate--tRNA ligase family protein, partial [Polyangiales bacterium]